MYNRGGYVAATGPERQEKTAVSVTTGSAAALRGGATQVLHGNDAGGWTKASPHLYPHQWNWDSAFSAIGWAHLDVRRAMTELEHLFAAQWLTGMVPHIVFRAGPGEPYFPGPERWECAIAPGAPAHPVQTTGICQPPVHAIAVQRIWQLTPQALRPEIRGRIQALYPRLVKWHRYLATQRDPEASGLVTCYHPWESTDNSPRWDQTLTRIDVAKLSPYTRVDTRRVGDPSQRPTNWDYDRYLWLVSLLRKYRYDDAQIYRHYPFLIKDVFFSAVLVAANAALLDLADVAGASDGDRGQLAAGWTAAARGWRSASTRSPACAPTMTSGRGADPAADVREFRAAVRADPGPWPARGPAAGARLRGLLRQPAVPLAPAAEHESRRTVVEPHNYWRGPSSPITDWLLWHSLSQLGYSDRADEIRRDSLGQIAAAGSSPSTSSPSRASRSARCTSPGRPPSCWTGRSEYTAARQAGRSAKRGMRPSTPHPTQ